MLYYNSKDTILEVLDELSHLIIATEYGVGILSSTFSHENCLNRTSNLPRCQS